MIKACEETGLWFCVIHKRQFGIWFQEVSEGSTRCSAFTAFTQLWLQTTVKLKLDCDVWLGGEALGDLQCFGGTKRTMCSCVNTGGGGQVTWDFCVQWHLRTDLASILFTFLNLCASVCNSLIALLFLQLELPCTLEVFHRFHTTELFLP